MNYNNTNTRIASTSFLLFVSLCLCGFLFSADLIKRNFSWTLEGDNDSILQITNESEQTRKIAVRLFFGDNSYRYPGNLEIPSGESRFLRIREILGEIGTRYPELQNKISGLVQVEYEGEEGDLQIRMIHLNPKSGLTSEKDSEQRGAPLLRSIDPKTGDPRGGTIVTIAGENFSDSSAVRFGGIPALRSRQSEDVLVAVAPAHSEGPVDVEVINGKRKARLKLAFRYESQPPAILELDPENGPARGGTRVNIRGHNFKDGATVRWNGVQLAARFVNQEVLFAVTPPGRSGPVSIEVGNPDGKTAVLPDAFRYKGSPQIASISPQMGSPAGGYTITISGNDFEEGSSVLIGSQYAQTTFINPNTLAAIAPAGESGSSDVTVTDQHGERDTLTGSFLYNDPPNILSMTAYPNPIVRNTSSTITVKAADPEAGALRYEYRVAQGPSGAYVTGQSEQAIFTSPNTTGTAVIQVTVYDEHRAKTQGTLEIEVE